MQAKNKDILSIDLPRYEAVCQDVENWERYCRCALTGSSLLVYFVLVTTLLLLVYEAHLHFHIFGSIKYLLLNYGLLFSASAMSCAASLCCHRATAFDEEGPRVPFGPRACKFWLCSGAMSGVLIGLMCAHAFFGHIVAASIMAGIPFLVKKVFGKSIFVMARVVRGVVMAPVGHVRHLLLRVQHPEWARVIKYRPTGEALGLLENTPFVLSPNMRGRGSATTHLSYDEFRYLNE